MQAKGDWLAMACGACPPGCEDDGSPDLGSLAPGTGTDPMVAIMARIPMLGRGTDGPISSEVKGPEVVIFNKCWC